MGTRFRKVVGPSLPAALLLVVSCTASTCAQGAAAIATAACSSDESVGQMQPGQVQSPASQPISEDVSLTKWATYKRLLLDVRHDQATTVKFPLSLAQGHHWKPALAFAAITAGFIALDPHDSPYFGQTTSYHTFNHVVSGVNSAIAMAAIPAVFYAISAKRGDSYGKQTVYLAAEAAIDTQIVDFGMKAITRRLRPVDIKAGGSYSDTWFKTGFLDGKSFPSGHVMTAFALADVFTERYPSHRWIPWAAYGLAGVISFSRLTLQAHFPSDEFAGAVLGTVISHYLVLHHHHAP